MLVSKDIYHCSTERDADLMCRALRARFSKQADLWEFRVRPGPAGSTAVYAFASHADGVEVPGLMREFTMFAEGFYAGLTIPSCTRGSP